MLLTCQSRQEVTNRRVAKAVELSAQDDRRLRILSKRKRVQARVAQRARIVLLAARGLSDKDIAAQVDLERRTVARWRARYLAMGIEELLRDATRPGRPAKIDARRIAEVVRKPLQEKPAKRTHWSTRTLAAHTGLSEASIRRIWHAHGLKPHWVRTFKLSNDPRFVEKLEDIVGLYLNPPENALLLSCDEKSQIQALDRTQPGLPLNKGRCQTMTHDYAPKEVPLGDAPKEVPLGDKRNGTTTRFAALNMLNGAVIGQCMQRHRHQEWLRFLRQIDQATPKDKQLHLIADNYATHKHPKVKAWLAKHPRFHMHFTPTSASWLNMVERFFRDISENQLRHGVFHNVPELVQTIDHYLKQHHQNPKPFIWTARACDILAKATRARAKLNKALSV